MTEEAMKTWEVSDRPRKSFASGKLMYHVDGPEIIFDYEDWGYTKESARLISAAPDLLEVLQWFMPFIESEQDDERQAPWVEKARAAIAKAEGEKT